MIQSSSQQRHLCESQLCPHKHGSNRHHPRNRHRPSPPAHGMAETPELSLRGPLPAWAFGLSFAVVGYTFCGMGMNLIKLSHIKLSPAAPQRETRFNRRTGPLHSNALWLSGYAINSAGGVLNTIGLRFAAQTLLAPLSSMALVSNALFATVLLGERLCFASDALPMVLIPIGNILAVAAANHDDQRGFTVDEIMVLFRRPKFSVYVAVCLTLASSLMIARSQILRRIRRTGGEGFASPTLVAYSGLCHAGAAALLCVNSVFLMKASLLVLADGLHNVIRPQFAVLILCYLVLCFFWIYTLNRLLAKHDVLFIVPVIEVLWSCGVIVSGGVFFDEYATLGIGRRIQFAAGVLISFFGVFLLSKRAEKGRAAQKLG